MSALQAERILIADTLQAAGLPVTRNPSSVDPPGVLVAAPTVQRNRQAGGCVSVEADFPIWVVGLQPGTDEQLAQMLDLVEQVLVALPRTALEPTGPTTYQAAGKELPAYRLDLPRQVTIKE